MKQLGRKSARENRPGEEKGSRELVSEIAQVDLDIREGRFQRWLALIAGVSSVLSGTGVAYEHYKGSYSRRVMYTPVILSAALVAAGVSGFFSRRASRTILPVVSALTLADCAAGFFFHVRGIHRKPGRWRLPVVNVVMGPPVFAPLLFGTSAYLGLLASFLRRAEQDDSRILPRATHDGHWAAALIGEHESIGVGQDVREGRFQKQMAIRR